MSSLRSVICAVLVAAVLFPVQAHCGPRQFVRGDITVRGRLSVHDAILILRFLFQGDPVDLSCEDAADVDDDGQVALPDALHVLVYLFRFGPPPPAPFPDCGLDPTEDSLGCRLQFSCNPGYGFFYVLDRSGGFDGLPLAKQEVLRNVEGFREWVQFGIVFFDASVQKFPADGKPVPATEASKQEAREFIEGMVQGSGTCPQSGLLTALEMAGASTAGQNVIVYLGDGGGTCPGAASEDAYLEETLEVVEEKNTEQYQINTVGLGTFIPSGVSFMKRLAAANFGTYTRISQ